MEAVDQHLALQWEARAPHAIMRALLRNSKIIPTVLFVVARQFVQI